MSMRMPNKSAAENNVVVIFPQPLFTHLGTLLLIVGMVVVFFISQLIGIYIAGKLLLSTAESTTLGDIFFFGSNDGTVVSISIMIGCVLLVAISALVV